MATRDGHDWPALKAEFAGGEESLTVFARRKGLALSNVKRRARVDLWDDARSTFRKDVAARANDEKVKFRARTEAEIDNRAHLIADSTTTLIQKRLKSLLEAEGTVDPADDGDAGKDGKGRRTSKRKRSANALEIKLLTDALNNSYELQRITAGLTRQKVPERVQVEATLEVSTGVMEMPKMKPE